MKTMGEIIACKRREKGMTQAELASKMNVTDKAVSKWERNLSCPDVNSLSRLAEVLELPVNELLSAKAEGEPKSEAAKIIQLMLKAVPLAMGIAVTVLSILKEIDPASALTMLGIGLACLSVSALNGGNE